VQNPDIKLVQMAKYIQQICRLACPHYMQKKFC